MNAVLSRKTKATLVLMASVLALTMGLLSGPASAQASTSNYCTGWLGGGSICEGAPRQLYQTYGWGDQGSVCVSVVLWMGPTCSSGAGAGVYSGQISSNVYATPWIKNNIGGSNFVHGVVLTH